MRKIYTITFKFLLFFVVLQNFVQASSSKKLSIMPKIDEDIEYNQLTYNNSMQEDISIHVKNDKKYTTVLDYTAYENFTGSMLDLIHDDENLNQIKDFHKSPMNTQYNLFLEAVQLNNVSLVKLLYCHTWAVKNNFLYQAAQHNADRVAQFLLEQGFVMDLKNDKGISPFDWAIEHNSQAVIKVFNDYTLLRQSKKEKKSFKKIRNEKENRRKQSVDDFFENEEKNQKNKTNCCVLS